MQNVGIPTSDFIFLCPVGHKNHYLVISLLLCLLNLSLDFLLHTKHTHTHTHTFYGPFSGTTQVSRYQKSKTNLDFPEARDSEWQWHQLGHMQVCTSLQTDNHASTPPLIFYRPDALPAAQPTTSKHWRQIVTYESDVVIFLTDVVHIPGFCRIYFYNTFDDQDGCEWVNW